MTEASSVNSLVGRFAQFVDRHACVPVLLVLLFLSALFPVIVFPAHGIGDMVPLDLYFSYDPDQVHSHLSALGEQGRRAYAGMLLISDMVFPLFYTSALSVALVLGLRSKLAPGHRRLCLFPFLVVIADWCENLCLATAVRAYPDSVDTVVRIASISTSLKWALLAVTLLMLLAAAVYRLVQKKG